MLPDLRLFFAALLTLACLNASATECPDWPSERALNEVGTLQQQIDLWDDSYPVSYTHLTLPTNREV